MIADRIIINLRRAGEEWIAEAEVGGRVFSVQSQFETPNRLAEQLVAAGLPDGPVEIVGLPGRVRWPSFHRAVAAYCEISLDDLKPPPARNWQPLLKWQIEK